MNAIPTTTTTAFATMSIPQLTAAAKAAGHHGYSALNKGELVAFMTAGGVKPAATPGSARGLAEEAKVLKASGKIVGPISALSVSALRSAIRATKAQDAPVTVAKPKPKAGTADHNRGLLGAQDRTAVNVWLTLTYGKGVSISSAKADQLTAAVAHFAKVKAAA